VAVEAWKRRYNEEALNVMWDATRKRGEKAIVEKLRLRMKSASAKSLVNGRSQVRAVTCHLNDAEKRQASKRAVEENESSSVTARSRCWGKAAAPNDVIILSSSSSSPSSIVKFHHVTENQQKSKKKKKNKRQKKSQAK
jgi:hypothetical protein